VPERSTGWLPNHQKLKRAGLYSGPGKPVEGVRDAGGPVINGRKSGSGRRMMFLSIFLSCYLWCDFADVR